jgi:Ca2+-binding RTX toxin-like protein
LYLNTTTTPGGALAFAASPNIDMAPSATLGEIVLLDVNGDGRGELLFKGGDGSMQATFFNANSTVNFVISSTLVNGKHSLGQATKGDFNGDGILDAIFIATPQNGVPTIAITALGKKDGTFEEMVKQQNVTGSAPTAFVGDVTGDGKVDLVLVESGGWNRGYDGNYWVYNNFQSMSDSGATGWRTNGQYSLSDINGDGRSEVVFAANDGTYKATSGSFSGGFGSVLLNGKQTLGQALSADINGDGVADSIWRHSNNSIQVGFGTKNATTGVVSYSAFGPWQNVEGAIPEGSTFADNLFAADLNGDLKAELIWVKSGAGGAAIGDATVLLNTTPTNATWKGYWSSNNTSGNTTGMSNTSPGLVSFEDVNGDGRLDLIRTTAPGYESVFLGQGNGGLGALIAMNKVEVKTPSDSTNYDLSGSSNTQATIYGNALGQAITGTSWNDRIYGFDGNDTLNGGAGADELNGGTGNDWINGGTGSDTLIGGAGNDTYVVDSTTDTITENANEGTDLVQSSVTYTLGTNVENLTLTGTTAINGTGNSLNNVLTGNGVDNVLDGGAGSDTLIGGLGNDIYVVDSTGDVVTENANEGTDLVSSSVTYTLGTNVENLTLTGSIAINGTGNSLNNIITGNGANNVLNGGAGNDTLIGGAGNDTLIGGAGNDTYVVDNAADVVTENVNEGTDLVQSSVTYTLRSNIENLTLTGTGTINGTGNSQNNTITGNTGNNVLDGGVGNDTLIGGGGSDTYLFTRGNGQDTIFDSDLTPEIKDTLRFFDTTVSANQLWFRKAAGTNDLEISVIGTDDKVMVKDWYVGAASQIEEIYDGTGKKLVAANVANLVNAMASFAPPASGQLELQGTTAASLNPIIAANWKV